MKLLLLEPDKEFAQKVTDALNSTRTKFDITYLSNEDKIYALASSFEEFAIFVLNLKNCTDMRVETFIRENGGSSAPILLILNKEIVNFQLYKTLHYLDRNHDLVIKDNLIEPVIHRIFKLCNIWNDDIFFLSQDIYFDYKGPFFVYQGEQIHLGNKEARLLKLLFIKSPNPINHDEIAHFVYQDDFTSNEKVRALIKILRQKIPMDLIRTEKFIGYKITKKFYIQ